jgi:hypothetical protein
MRIITSSIAASALLLFLSTSAPAQVSIDVQIGQPPPPPQAYRVPAAPGPDYVWVEGYWYPQGKRYVWHNGYWTHPPYAGAYWVAPYYERGHYYAGRWEGERGNVYHNHKWDHDKRRDEHHEPEHERGRR